MRLVRLFLALGAIVVGVFLMVLPGPAVVFFFIGGAMLATESRYVARFLDWFEVKMRAGWNWVQPRWHRLPGIGKFALTGLAACLGASLAYASFRLFTR